MLQSIGGALMALVGWIGIVVVGGMILAYMLGSAAFLAGWPI